MTTTTRGAYRQRLVAHQDYFFDVWTHHPRVPRGILLRSLPSVAASAPTGPPAGRRNKFNRALHFEAGVNCICAVVFYRMTAGAEIRQNLISRDVLWLWRSAPPRFDRVADFPSPSLSCLPASGRQAPPNCPLLVSPAWDLSPLRARASQWRPCGGEGRTDYHGRVKFVVTPLSRVKSHPPSSRCRENERNFRSQLPPFYSLRHTTSYGAFINSILDVGKIDYSDDLQK